MNSFKGITCITVWLTVIVLVFAFTNASTNETVPKAKILPFLEDNEDSNSLEARRGNKTQKILTRPLSPQTTTTTPHNPYVLHPQYPGFNPGSAAGPGYIPGSPDGSGYNPGNGAGPGYIPGSPDGSGYNPGNGAGPGYIPGSGASPGYNPGNGAGPGYIPGHPMAPGYGDSSAQGSGIQTNVHHPPVNPNNYPNNQGNMMEQKNEQPPSGIPDIYVQLIGAIEKMVGRMDKLENRLRTVENILFHMTNKKDELPEQGSCPNNFRKVEGIRGKCYQISSYTKSPMIYDWKSAENECTRVGGRLVEMLNYEDFLRVSQFLIKYSSASNSATSDYWIGGINPGLIWIWAESGQPVEMNKRFWNDNDNSSTIPGCLKLSYSHRLNTYFFKHSPCGHSQNYICEIMDNTVSRALAHFEEQLWNESETL